jgi:hypothetical protein
LRLSAHFLVPKIWMFTAETRPYRIRGRPAAGSGRAAERSRGRFSFRRRLPILLG